MKILERLAYAYGYVRGFTWVVWRSIRTGTPATVEDYRIERWQKRREKGGTAG